MTPFGAKLRELRQSRNLTQAAMAKAVNVSPAYLSALEHGKRGQPSWHLVQSLIAHLNIIWDEAEELVKLARVSHPKVTLNTGGLSPMATLLANELAANINRIDDKTITALLARLRESIT